MLIPKNTQNPPRKKSKACQFPGCEEIFQAVGKEKYCEEHRKKKYRKELYTIPKSLSIVYDHNNEPVKCSELNQTIVLSKPYAEKRTLLCKACNAPYEVVVVPSIDVYPNFCEEHRSEFKRNLYLKNNPKVAEEKKTTDFENLF